MEKFTVRIRQEFVSTESKANRVLLDPLLFSAQGLGLVGRWLGLDLPQVVSALVIRDDEGIGLACILNAVGIVVVLSWRFDHHTSLCHLIQGAH